MIRSIFKKNLCIGLLLVLLFVLCSCSKFGFEERLYNEICDKKCLSEYPRDIEINSVATVKLGKYEQDNNFDNGKEDIEWIVVEKEGGKALLLSKYIIDLKQYDELLGEDGHIINKQDNFEAILTDWKNSDVRKWLNDDFYVETFNKEEKNIICGSEISFSVEHKNLYSHGSFSKEYGQVEEKDKLFLLSTHDINLYMGRTGNNPNKKIIAEASEYVKNIFDKNYKEKYVKNMYFDDKELEGERFINYFVTNCQTYMLRDVAKVDDYNLVKCVDENGYMAKFGKCFELTPYNSLDSDRIKKYNKADVNNFVMGIRPAMWVDFGNRVLSKKELIDDRIGSDSAVKYYIHDIGKMHAITEYSVNTDVDDYDTVCFGKWEQDANFENGAEDIEWILLEKDEKNAKLISKYVLDYGYQMQFNSHFAFSNEEVKCVKEIYQEAENNNVNLCDYISNDEILKYDDAVTESSYGYKTRKFNAQYTKYAKYLMNFYPEEYKYDGYWIKDVIKDLGYAGGTDISRCVNRLRVSEKGEVSEYGKAYWSWGGYSSNEYSIGTDRYVCGVRPVIHLLIDTINDYEPSGNDTYFYRDFEYGKTFTIDNIEKARPLLNETEGVTYDYIVDYSYTGIEPNFIEGQGYVINDKYYNQGTVRDMFDTIKFGKYEQDNNLDNGPEDIEWIVIQLDRPSKHVRLLSKYVLDYMEYQHNDNEKANKYGGIEKIYDKNYVTSDVRKFLNNQFYESAFSEEEKNKLLLVHSVYENHDVYDKVYIPPDLQGSNSTDATVYTDYAQDKFLKDETYSFEKNPDVKRTDYFLEPSYQYINGYNACRFYDIRPKGVRPMIVIKIE